VVRSPVPTYTTLESIYGLNLNRVLGGALTPEQCVTDTTTLWTNVLKGNFMIPYSLQSYDDTLDNAKKVIAELGG
jgi:multiple sugar transport system substrate-binding protein